jgi:hypothetical protein
MLAWVIMYYTGLWKVNPFINFHQSAARTNPHFLPWNPLGPIRLAPETSGPGNPERQEGAWPVQSDGLSQ